LCVSINDNKENGLAEPELITSEKMEFEILVKKNMKRAYFTAIGMLCSHDAAMDVSQQAFINAFRNFDKFDKNKKFFTWYYKILKNLCLNFIRDKKNRKEQVYLESKDGELISNNPEEEIEKKDLVEKLQQALSELNIDDREIIILKELENYSYKEIAEILEIPVGSVMSRLFYARKKLSEKVKSKI
jgi:RNA polymerase sigma-70 factor (ECF subfamily)